MAVFTVSNLNDAGAGSLREAIEAANADASGTPSVIRFSVDGSIVLASDLPAITRSVELDGTSAPGHLANGPPVVEIDCNGNAGLVFAAGSDSSQLLGVAVTNASGNGVTLEAGSITLNGNYIGLDLAGAAAGNGGDGVSISSTSWFNQIGYNPSRTIAGVTEADAVTTNVISGNAGNGIGLYGSSGNTIVSNHVGTNADGTAAIANAGNGIRATAGSNGNQIGGAAFKVTGDPAVNDPTGDKGTQPPVFVVPPLGNLVSGNGQNGILIDSDSRNNQLNGNFVGTTADGNAAIGNTLDGVRIDGSDGNAVIGCEFVNNPFVYYNVISGNGGNGLHITNSDNVIVHANFFGIGANNGVIVANALNGVLVDGTSANTQFGGVIPLGNVSAGNGANGVAITDSASGFSSLNTFGGIFAFGPPAPNQIDGLLITATGGNHVIQTNVFSGNLDDGIEIGGDASGITLDPNIVGLNTTGTSATYEYDDGTSVSYANLDNGIEINGSAHDIVIGGNQLSVMPRSVFSNNGGYGITITDQAYQVQVVNTFVGTGVFGEVAFGNQLGGILVDDKATRNTIGDVLATATLPKAVLISGNTGNGITLGSGTSFTQILNNVIGYDRTQTSVLPNTGVSIEVNDSTGNTISGNVVASCFAAGTRIATGSGSVAVEHLRPGDLVRTIGGGILPVRWIGHRQVDCRRHPRPASVQPVRIAAHAFARNQPDRDLFLSPDHAIYREGSLIPVHCLVNGTTISRVDADSVTYFHVELDRHDVIFAEGLPAETYLDTGDRAHFANAGPVLTLHPAWGRPAGEVALLFDALGFAPLRLTGPEVDRTRTLLAARSARRAKTRRSGAGSPARPAALPRLSRRHP